MRAHPGAHPALTPTLPLPYGRAPRRSSRAARIAGLSCPSPVKAIISCGGPGRAAPGSLSIETVSNMYKHQTCLHAVHNALMRNKNILTFPDARRPLAALARGGRQGAAAPSPRAPSGGAPPRPTCRAAAPRRGCTGAGSGRRLARRARTQRQLVPAVDLPGVERLAVRVHQALHLQRLRRGRHVGRHQLPRHHLRARARGAPSDARGRARHRPDQAHVLWQVRRAYVHTHS